jgi:hypothetical protein
VFEYRVLRRMLAPKKDEVTGGWRKLHNEEVHNLYPSESTIRMIKSKEYEVGRAYSTHLEKRNHVGYWWESQKEREHQENQT